VTGTDNSRIDTELRFAIREWLVRLRNWRLFVALTGVIFVFTWLAPFGTDARLSGWELPLYWTLAIGLNSPLGALVLPMSVFFARTAAWPEWVGVLVGALLVALPGTGVVLLLEAWLAAPLTMAWDLAYVYASVALVHVIIGYLTQEALQRRQPLAAHKAQHLAPFLARLSPSLGPNLLHLRMRDHYVEANTDAGSELILMRFGDALNEVEGIEGARVHRSHWVARSAVRRLLREDGKMTLELTNGTRVPVSRSYRQAALDLEI